MRTALYFAAAALMAVGMTPAAAQRWYRGGGDRMGVGYVDADSLSGESDDRRARVYTVYGEPIDGQLYAAAVRITFHCGERYYRSIEYSYYGADNALLATEASRRPDQHLLTPPGSLNELFFHFICEGTGGTAVGNDAWSDGQAFLVAARGQ